MTNEPTPRRSPLRGLPGAALLVAALLVGSAGGAVGGSLVTGAGIKDGTVASVDIKDRTVQVKDLSAAAVAGLRGQRGAPGTDGTDGADGTDGVLGYELVAASKPVQAGQADAVEVACPTGKMVLGGSGFLNNTNQAVQFEIRSGGTSGKAWTTGAPADATLLVNVVCALVSP